MLLARAEGSRLRLDRETDLAPVAGLIVADFRRFEHGDRIRPDPPDGPVMSDLDPDAFGILLRNVIENALRHGAPGGPVEVRFPAGRALAVANDRAPVPADQRARTSSSSPAAAAPATAPGPASPSSVCWPRAAAPASPSPPPRPGSDLGREARFRF